jgi:hypothetical protein
VLAAATIFTIGPEYARSLEDYRLIGFSVILLILVRLAPRGVGPMALDPIARLIDRARRPRGGAERFAPETEPALDEGTRGVSEVSAGSRTNTVTGPPA